MTCWSCKAEAGEAITCPACNRLLPEAPGADLFAALGLPRRFAVASDALEQRFRERSRLLHPDRFARAEPRERRISLERTTRLNDAVRTLRDPSRRAEYLLKLAGHDPIAEGKLLRDPEFLEEQLEVREALAAARRAADTAGRGRIVEEARGKLSRVHEELAGLFARTESGEDLWQDIVRHVIRARYYETIATDAA